MLSFLASMCIFNTFMACVFYLRHENPLFYIIVGGIFSAAASFFPRAKTSANEDDDDDKDDKDEEDEEDSENDKDESAARNLWG